MPKWIHDRAEHILAKNPSMEKGTAFAIATQQAHALGKSSKGYGTSEGRRAAKAKYDAPKKNYKKAANPGRLSSPKMEKKGAEEESPPTTSPKKKMLYGLGGAIGSGLLNAGSISGSLATVHQPRFGTLPRNNLESLEKAIANRGADRALYEKLKDTSKIEVIEDIFFPQAAYARKEKYLDSRYTGDKPKIVLGYRFMNPYALSHEMGHSALDQRRLGRIIQSPASRLLMHFSPTAGFLTGALSGFSDDDRVKALGVAAPLIAAAPTLASEAGASLIGLKKLKDLGANRRQLLLGGLSGALGFGSYLGQAGFGSGVAALTQGAAEAFKARNKQGDNKKQASLEDEIKSTLGEDLESPIVRLKDAINRESEMLAKNPAPRRYLAQRLTTAITPGLEEKKAAEAKSDEELKELGRQRAVTNLASEARREAGRRGERFGQGLGGLLGAAGGAVAGRKLIGGAPGAIAGLTGGYMAGGRFGKELGTELDIQKNAFRLSRYAGGPPHNPPGMRQGSPVPPFRVPPLAVKEVDGQLKWANLDRPQLATEKKAFRVSQYSGPLSYGPFKQTSGIPPFKAPSMTKFDEKAGVPKPWMVGSDKTGAAMSPAQRLAKAQRVGAPKVTAPAGPSIADVSKPHGYGQKLPGATKNRI